MEKKKITLNSGLQLEVDLDVMDDWEVFELLREIDKGETGAIVDLIPMCLGEKQFKALKEHLKSENGKIKASDMVNAFYELLEKVNALKN